MHENDNMQDLHRKVLLSSLSLTGRNGERLDVVFFRHETRERWHCASGTAYMACRFQGDTSPSAAKTLLRMGIGEDKKDTGVDEALVKQVMERLGLRTLAPASFLAFLLSVALPWEPLRCDYVSIFEAWELRRLKSKKLTFFGDGLQSMRRGMSRATASFLNEVAACSCLLRPGRYLRARRMWALMFLMGQHKRLGANSHVRLLADLPIHLIVNHLLAHRFTEEGLGDTLDDLNPDFPDWTAEEVVVEEEEEEEESLLFLVAS